jgi:hypothetical protein
VSDGDDGAAANHYQQKPQRPDHQPYRGRLGRRRGQKRIFDRSFSPRLKSWLGLAQSGGCAFDFSEVTHKLIDVRE